MGIGVRLRVRIRFADAHILLGLVANVLVFLQFNAALIGGGDARSVLFRRGQRGLIVANDDGADVAAAYRPAGGNGTAHVRVEPVRSAAAVARS